MKVDLHSIWSMTIDSGCGSSQVEAQQVTANTGTLMAQIQDIMSFSQIQIRNLPRHFS
jgi:hypothetical protein